MTAAREQQVQAIAISRPSRLIVIALWFGLIVGLGEASLVGAGKVVLGHYVHESLHIAWMAPGAEAIMMGSLGSILALAVWRWRRLGILRAGLFLIAFLGSLSVLLRVGWLHGYASVVLAVGVAVQASRLVIAHADGLHQLVRRTVVWIIAIVGLLAIGVFWGRAISESRAQAKLPPAVAGSPNVLLIVMDTVRAQNLSLYGYSRLTTPNLEKLAQTGVRFDRAISTAPWTLPSHASMFTGRYPNELSVGWAATLDSAYPTLAEILSAHGYLAAGFVANTQYCSSESGLDRGFTHYEGYPVSMKQLVLSSSLIETTVSSKALNAMGYDRSLLDRKTAEKLNGDFLSWLSHKDVQRPFFAFLNYFDAHSPYSPPEPFDAMFGPNRKRDNPQMRLRDKWTEPQVQSELDAYDSSIAYLDHQIGVLLEQLQKRGLRENTLIIVTADHGEEFYEHGTMTHGWSTYMASIHVPLLVSFPSRVPSGKIVSEPVTLRDLAATVVGLLGLGAETRFPGNSLARYWDSSQSGSRADSPILTELTLETEKVPGHYPILRGGGSLSSLVNDQYHFIKSNSGHEELYNIENDPLEQNNVVTSEQGRGIAQAFRTRLESVVARNEPQH
jgi:arylsulfatase A-like enzyme